MSSFSLISFTDEVLETTFNCPMCHGILTPPILLVQDVGNVCSTCFQKTDRTYLHNEAMEKILKLLMLPCKYKGDGCNERLVYNEMVWHEKECRFRTRSCPMADGWQGNSESFLMHFKEFHAEHVIKFDTVNQFLVETSLNDPDVVKMIEGKLHTFVLRVKSDKQRNKLHYMLCLMKESRRMAGTLDYSVKHKGESKNYITTKSTVLSCDYIYGAFDESVAVEVDLEALKSISAVTETFVNVFKINFEDGFEGMDKEMLHFFECPICKQFMKPPIYQCQSGHSICNACRPRLEKCPTCRAFFGSTRNYSLEGLTSGVLYPCTFHELGCSETAMASAITLHEKKCNFRPQSCPFPSCTANGNHQDIISHLMNIHSSSVITTGFTESFRLDQNTTSYNRVWDRKCLITDNHIFRLSCKRVADHCMWAAEVYGWYDDTVTFVYEVTIIDARRPEKKLIRTDYCLIDVSEEDLFKRCIIFSNNMLSAYSNHGIITFSVQVREK